jgi:hypothetical protein
MQSLFGGRFPVDILKAPERLKSFVVSHGKLLKKIAHILGDAFVIPEAYKLGDLRKELEQVRVGNKATWKIFNISLVDISQEDTAACTPYIKKLVNEVKQTSIKALFDLIPTNYVDILQSQKAGLCDNIEKNVDDFITLTLNHHELMNDYFKFSLAVINDPKFESLYNECAILLSFDKSALITQTLSLLPQILPLLAQLETMSKITQ